VDEYGRLLRYVVRASDDMNVNVRLVRLGADHAVPLESGR
jgi:endonuclease YncB( thermonuclease family)